MHNIRSESAVTERPGDAGPWDRRMLFLLAAVLVGRLAYAVVFPLDLAPDESYYWDWGRRPDIGYFSKPPMIGWLMGLAGWLGGDSQVMLKVFPGVLAVAGLGFVYLLGRDLFGGKAGWMATVLLLATPANSALSTFFTIDAPLFLFWSAALWFAWRWTCGRPGPWGAWLVVALGAGFLTKQIQLVFPVLLLVYLRVSPPGEGAARHRLLRLGGITLLAGMFLVPPLLWNWRHDWITFRHTADEIAHNPFRIGRSLRFFLEFVGGQIALGGGGTTLFMVGVLGMAVRQWRVGDPRARFLTLFALPGLAAYALFAFRQRVEQNWAMVFYTSATVLLAGWLAGGWSGGRPRPRTFRWLVGIGGALALALLAVPFVLPHTALAGAKADPTGRIRGWRLLADRVQPFRSGVPRPDQTFLLAPDDRYVASALAFYLPDHPRTFCWEDPRRPESQYGVWGRPGEHLGWDALVLGGNLQTSSAMRDVAGRFESWERLGEIHIRLGPRADRDRTYGVYLGRRLRSVEVLDKSPDR